MSHTECPWCGAVNDCDDAIDGTASKPTVGDVSVCFDCTGPSYYTDTEGGKRRPDPEELAKILADPDIANALSALRNVKARPRREA